MPTDELPRDVTGPANERAGRLAAALMAAGACAWWWTAESGRVETTPGAAALLGKAPDTLDAFDALVCEADRPVRRVGLARALARGEPWVVSFRVDAPPAGCGGGGRWVEERGRVLLDDAGQPAVAVALVVDVTGRKESERVLEAALRTESRERRAAVAASGAAEATVRALERSEAFLESIFASMTDGLVLFDADGRVTRINPAAREMLGFPEQLDGAPPDPPLSRLVVLDIEGRTVQHERLPVAVALRGEALHGLPLAFRRPDGRTVWATVGAAPLRAPDGAIVGAVLSLGDVTQLRALEEQREDLSRMISHDLRTPLGIVVNHARVLGRRSEPPEAIRARAEAILVSAQRMAAMLDDLVETALLESGKLRLELGPVRLLELLRELRRHLEALAGGERVRIEAAGEVPEILADANRLQRVFTNLLTNALKYSAPGTEVAVRVSREEEHAVVSVRDQGQGIAPEDVPHLFERFYRGARAFPLEGMGMGLYTARMLVEAHGGTIRVSTTPGQGSEFRVVLPLRGGDSG